MESEDLERLLDSGRFQHLSEATLMSYREYRLDKTRVAMADAHLKLCLVCKHRLTFLQAEADAVAEYVVTDD